MGGVKDFELSPSLPALTPRPLPNGWCYWLPYIRQLGEGAKAEKEPKKSEREVARNLRAEARSNAEEKPPPNSEVLSSRGAISDVAPRSSGEAHLACGSVSDAIPETRGIASSKTPRNDGVE